MSHAESTNPYTGETIRRYEHHGDAEIDARLDAAAEAQRAWARRPFEERAGLLERAAALLDERAPRLARLASLEMGKRLDEATGEVGKCAWVCRYYAAAGGHQLADRPLADDDGKQSFVSHHPLGVLLAVMPWNFPFWQVLRAAAPALMAGNGVLLKHASSVTGCALAIEQLLQDAGFPRGLFGALVISGRRASELLDDRRVAGATLTGSEGAGSALAAAAGSALKPTVLELGGSDPFVVLDLERDDLVSSAVTSRFMNAGQSCIAAKRFIVLEAVYEDFLAAFREAVEALVPGDPLAADTTLSPLASHAQRDTVADQVERARNAGATVDDVGRVPEGPGAFHPPTLLLDLPRDADVYREEIFGPVASVFRARDADHAVEIANDSPYGLGGSVWSGQPAQALAVARRIASGAVYVNRIMASDPRLPFGGIKRSGYGRELAADGIRAFVNAKTISVRF